MNVLTDDQLRHMGVSLLRKPSQRTLQERIGASDMADECDRCLAMRMRGIKRTSPQAERPWFGAEWGTAVHLLMQERIDGLMAQIDDDESLTPAERQQVALYVEATFGVPRGTKTETRLMVADLKGYGPVFGHIDLDLPYQIVDWKGSTRIKSALLQDFLAQTNGNEARRWEKQKDTARYEGGYKLKLDSKTVASMSNRAYREAMDGMVYKMNRYFGQQTMYLHGRHLAGRPAVKGSILWLNRDGNGYFDDPGSDRYEDPQAHHDVWVLSFGYHEAEAQRLIARAEGIWAKLEAGAPFSEFEQSDHCYVCSFEEREAERLMADSPSIDANIEGLAA